MILFGVDVRRPPLVGIVAALAGTALSVGFLYGLGWLSSRRVDREGVLVMASAALAGTLLGACHVTVREYGVRALLFMGGLGAAFYVAGNALWSALR